ncbi:hypothetical protein ACL655_01520 [Klebsiella quasipneumoniae subsp. similipneumoniae]
MNIWQIDMERSPYSNTLLFNLQKPINVFACVLALVQGGLLYDQQIFKRAKPVRPFSQLPSAVPAAGA